MSLRAFSPPVGSYLQPTVTACSATVVLNSTTNLNQALSAFEGAKTVNCYFENDNAGRSSFAKLRALYLPVEDCSSIYGSCNDFNDIVCHVTV